MPLNKVVKYVSEADRKASENERPFPGYRLTPTIHHSTYPAVNPRNFDLSGKVVFISGASRGIGKETALSFSRAGASGIVITSRSVADLDAVEDLILEAAAEVGHETKVLKIKLDLLDLNTAQSAADEVKKIFGRLDVLVNNAGCIDAAQTMSEIDPSEWLATMTTNVQGTFAVTRALLPLLLSSENGAKIVINMASAQALTTGLYCSAYGVGLFQIMHTTGNLLTNNV